jgi:hypothetical protein
VLQDPSLIETRVSDHFSKKKCIDLKTLSIGPYEIRRPYMQNIYIYIYIFIINLLVTNFLIEEWWDVASI